MKRKFIVVAYYTRNTEYEEEIKNLVFSLEKFNLPYHIQAIQDLGSWAKNTNYKPRFCKEMLKVFKCPVLYIDADAVVRQDPILFNDIDCDIAVHYKNGKELLTGTLYLNWTDNARRIVDEWISEVARCSNMWEQKNLSKVLERLRFKMIELPPTYCQIYDLMKNAGEPVIEHYQASRRFKGGVNAK